MPVRAIHSTAEDYINKGIFHLQESEKEWKKDLKTSRLGSCRSGLESVVVRRTLTELRTEIEIWEYCLDLLDNEKVAVNVHEQIEETLKKSNTKYRI